MRARDDVVRAQLRQPPVLPLRAHAQRRLHGGRLRHFQYGVGHGESTVLVSESGEGGHFFFFFPTLIGGGVGGLLSFCGSSNLLGFELRLESNKTRFVSFIVCVGATREG